MQETLTPPDGTDDEDKFYRFIFENAQGIVIILRSAPTTAGGELKANEIGYYSSNLYWNINGTVYRISLTQV